ncbi:MAG: uroporphyrinogen-III C-methyltransferase [Crocinitomicaceae bacterium]|nr:uroporphyrinogen-III C-methyltransferase [Crocinitomicaceae bacterium]
MRTQNKLFTLVGAGPGDPELISIKGIKALNTADVVLYDALVDTSLLDHAPRAKKIFVGKRLGYKKYNQEEINTLIVQSAFNYGHVVRLKGGDPFIFGRGSEEIEYAENFGIPTAIVPGISSATSVPASLGISPTKRGVSESYWIITGTTKTGSLSEDIALAAQSTATVGILMGMSKLLEIVKLFQQNGKGETPVAIIQNGTLANERSGIGTINTIVEVVNQKQLSNPALIIIGETVAESHKLKDYLKNIELKPQPTILHSTL